MVSDVIVIDKERDTPKKRDLVFKKIVPKLTNSSSFADLIKDFRSFSDKGIFLIYLDCTHI